MKHDSIKYGWIEWTASGVSSDKWILILLKGINSKCCGENDDT